MSDFLPDSLSLTIYRMRQCTCCSHMRITESQCLTLWRLHLSYARLYLGYMMEAVMMEL